jgi:peroxiredoxin
VFYSAHQMPDFSSTLRLGDRAPDFTLPAANRPGNISLGDLLGAGPVIVEFLRGTW